MPSLRRRLSIRFFAGLLTVAAVLAVGTHFLHAYQVRRNAGALLTYADQARGEKDSAKELGHLSRYLGLNPDDADARARFVLLLEQNSTTPDAKFQALSAIEDCLRRHPDLDAVRRRAAEVNILFSSYTDAIDHLTRLREARLREAKPDDPELAELQGQCEEGQTKFPEAKVSYGIALKADPGRVSAAERLANLLRTRLEQRADADAVMTQLVDRNPNSYKARLARSRYFRDCGGAENNRRAAEDLLYALKLKPDEADVLLAAGDTALAAGKSGIDRARGQYERGLAKHPGDPRFSLALIGLELRAGRRAEALRLLADARRADYAGRGDVRWLLAGLYLDAGESDEAGKIVKELKDLARLDPNSRNAALDYLEARLRMADRQYAEARDLLEQQRSLRQEKGRQGFAAPELTRQVDLLLARCYERLGNPDKQLAVYDSVLAEDPLSAPAHLGRAAVFLAQGNLDEALRNYRVLLAREPDLADLRVAVGRILLLRVLRQPEGKREGYWPEVRQFLADTPSGARATADFRLLEAEVAAASGHLDEALTDLVKACRKEPKDVRFWTARAFLAGRGKSGFNADAALAVLDEAESQLDPGADLLLARASCLTAVASKKLPEGLKRIEEKAGQLPEDDRERVWRGLAAAYTRAGAVGDARRLLGLVAELRPAEVGVRLQLLDLALQQQDSAAALKSLTNELHVAEGEQGPFWRYATATRLLLDPERGSKPENLEEARRLLADAATRLPKWYRIRTLEGEVEERAGKADTALEKYQQALALGERRPAVVRRVVQLLVSQNRFEEASALLARWNTAGQPEGDGNLARMTAEVALLNHAGADKVKELTDKAAAFDSKDYKDHLWQGLVLAAVGKGKSKEELAAFDRARAEARAAFRRAVKLKPEAPEAWAALILLLAEDGLKKEAREELAFAGRAVPNDKLPTVLAPALEALGEVDAAEKQYQQLAKSNDPARLRNLATFYLRVGRAAKAEEMLHGLAAARGPGASSAAAWARRILALGLASTGDYTKSKEAVALLEQNLQSGSAAPEEDQRALALVQASRPGGRRDSIRTLEESFTRLRPNPAEEFLLARLYDADGNWDRASDLLAGLLAGAGRDNPDYLAWYIRGLLRNGKTEAAAAYFNRLKSVEPEGPRVTETGARLLAKKGQGGDAAREVEAFTEKEYAAKKDPAVLSAAAGLLDELGRTSEAEKLYRRYSSEAQKTRPESALVLAEFLSRHNRLGEALDLCEKVAGRCEPGAVVAVAVNAVRAAKAGGEDYRRVERLLNEAAAKGAPSVVLLLARANLLDAQENYTQAVDAYRQLLGQERHPVALNNLAWLLAVKNNNGQEALRLIDTAIKVAGPIAELLDTRATVLLACNDSGEAVKDAVKDLELAVAQSPNAARYFHQAQAYDRARNREAAASAWRKAREQGLRENDLHPLEREEYRRLVRELGEK